jgi:hypothetical protein
VKPCSDTRFDYQEIPDSQKISLEKKVMAILKKYIQERTTMVSWFIEPLDVTEAKDLMLFSDH